MSTAEIQSRRSRKLKIATGVIASVAALVMFAGTASATTTTLVKYDAKMHGYSKAIKGTGSVWQYRFTQPGVPSFTGWGAQASIKNLPQDTYTLAVSVGGDVDSEGHPHSFQLYNVCSFYASGVKGETAGCGAAPNFHQGVDLSHSSLIAFNSVTQLAFGDLVRSKK